jgi:guanylate cyclase
VIGRKRFLYDLWGDAVNTASRMESHGAPGRIQITRSTFELLADEFVCEPRGTIVVKGKGEIEVWYLVGPSVPQQLRTDAVEVGHQPVDHDRHGDRGEYERP